MQPCVEQSAREVREGYSERQGHTDLAFAVLQVRHRTAVFNDW